MAKVHTPPESVISALRAFGEDSVADRIPELPAAEQQRIGELAFRYALTGKDLGQALALGAVEVVEGKPRPLRRSGRRPRMEA